jgi:two-component system sensor kinase FixL
MKIRQKLILGFVGIASLVGVVGILCVNTSQSALQKSIGESSVALAVETMDKIDRHIYHTIEEFQAYCSDLILQETVTKSNREFEKRENLQGYIDEKNNEWISTQKPATTPLIQELLDNKLSEELRQKIGFHQEKHGYKVFGEVFVTNRYGATIALTEKTSDYRQDDELWWQKAREDDLYVGEVEYDESSGIYSFAIAIRYDDKEGNFNGVVKVVLNIEEAIDIIRKTKEIIRYNNAEFKLLSRNGKTIYDDSGEFNFLEDISNREFFQKLTGDRGYLQKKPEEENEKKIESLAFARSQGHDDYKGLGWILIIEYDTAELFAPVVKLRNIILSTSLVLTILAVIPGILISNYISKPLSKLEAAMDKIGNGDMNIHVDIKQNNEMGQLANTFNQMVEHRKQAEEALRISERQYSDLVQQSPDAIISLDKFGNFLSFNPAAERASGFSAHEVIGRNFTMVGVLDKDSIPKALKEFGLTLTGAERQPFDLTITRKDKSHVHMEANGRLIKQKGQKAWIQVTLRDITERKRAEDRLEKINTCLLNLVSDFTENADNITALLGELLGATCALYNRLDDDMLCSQAQWHTPLNYNPRDKANGHICYDVIRQGTNEAFVVRDLQNSSYAQTDPNVSAYGLQTYIGHAVSCKGRYIGSLCAVFQKDFEPSEDEKKIIGILASAMRVEEERSQAREELNRSQKAAEQALQTGELILDTMPVGVIIVGRDKIIRRVNKTALKMMGCKSPQDIIGYTCHKVICPAEVNKCPVIDLGNSVDNSEKVLLKSDGQEIPILKTVLPITLEGEEVFLEAFVDITERRQAEQELEKLNKDLELAVWELRRTNKELQEFAYITAHDLKTPLRGIGTLADWISKDYADKFDENGREQVRLLVEKAKQMSALIDDILQYSRLGHSNPEKQQVDLNEVLPKVISGINPPENIQITIENKLPVLMCEETQIIQVFQNLLSNGVKYMDKSEGQIKVGCIKQNGFWKFSIADNGPGIDEKYHKKIFKIFQTLSPRDRADSTGIGLSIVQKIIELNAGVVWVESELGKGSTFFFTFPKSVSRQQIPAGPTTEQA